MNVGSTLFPVNMKVRQVLNDVEVVVACSLQVRKARSSHPAVAVTIVSLGKALKFHIASSLSLMAMDSIRNEVSRVINLSCKNLFSNRANINLYKLNDVAD